MLRYAISTGAISSLTDTTADRLVARCGELARAGVDAVLLREKRLAPEDLVALTRSVVAACGQGGTKVVVAGSPAVALAGGAHGVHLSGGVGTPASVRVQMPKAWVSVSCHSLEEVEGARLAGADAVLFAPVFGKVVAGVEVVPGVGLLRLQQACAVAFPMAVFALGGVDEANVAACVQAGAAGVAGIRLFFGIAG